MPADLLSSPRCRAEQLGLPMPDDEHAVSACLPLWEHNIGYEEGDPEIHGMLQAAYPRFAFHPKIRELCAAAVPDGAGSRWLPFVNRNAATRAVEYVRHAGNVSAELHPLPDHEACGVIVPDASFSLLKQYWQHAGENLSSRSADLILRDQRAGCTETAARQSVRQRVAALQQVESSSVFLFPSGMAAIAGAWRAVQSFRNGATCQFGFPYVDTLKIQQRFPGASHSFFPLGNDGDLDQLTEQCKSTPPIAVFCEVPTNPLLVTPHLGQLRDLADKNDFVLIVDDTLGACGNLHALPYADIVVTSLTKYFSGYGNVLAGSLVINDNSKHATKLKALVTATHEEGLSDADAEVLNTNSADLDRRMSRINANAQALATYLRNHSEVESVYYPSSDDAGYELLRKDSGGFGGLLSIVLKNPAETTAATFDRLEVCKGPNLGTNFTLCCPYTILAHYEELDFVETCGVSRWLLRISVGTEEQGDLIGRFERALPPGENNS